MINYYLFCYGCDNFINFRALTSPPEPVQVVCESILMLNNVDEISWKSAKSYISDVYFLKKFSEFEYDKVNQKQAKEIKSFLKVCQSV